LHDLIVHLCTLIEALRPTLVLSPAYEGGHPDHDSLAFAVSAARLQIRPRFRHREYRLYHAGPNGTMASDDFLTIAGTASEVLRFSASERKQKAAMARAFRSQKDVLRQFEFTEERFRDAPAYDFTRPPHAGKLLYESWN
jgi:LmbE family N-acetylglucosaminyl deacetylase